MAQGKKTTVSMNFGDGSAIEEWVSFSLRDTYTDPLGEHRFVARPSRPNVGRYRELLRKGEIVTIFVNGVNQGGYIIQTVDILVSPQQGVVFTVVCHSPIITPYQGNANPAIQFPTTNDAPIVDFLLSVLAEYGLDTATLESKDNVGALTGRAIPGTGAAALQLQALKHGEAKVQDGEKAYELCARILTRLGLCLRFTLDNRSIMVSRPDYEQQPAYALVQSADESAPGDRLMGDFTVHETNDGQFSECRVRGQSNDKPGATTTARPDATVQAADVVHKLAAYRATGATFKPLILTDKSCTSYERALSVAKLALGGRAKDAWVLTGEVDGLVSQTGRVWTVNTIATTRIDVLDFNEPLWVLERALTQDPNGGQKTALKLIPPGALILGDIPG